MTNSEAKLPEDYVSREKLIPDTKTEQRVDSPYPFLDKNNKYVSAILSSNIDEIDKLSEEIKFLEKLKKLPDYEWSRLKEVIENWKLEIIKTKPVYFKKQKLEIQIKDNKYALYERWWNLLYFVNLNWEKYFNVDRVRHWLTGWWLESWIEMLFWWKQVLENWIYNIYIWNKKLDINSEEYIKIMLICCQDELNFAKDLKKEYERRFNKKIN